MPLSLILLISTLPLSFPTLYLSPLSFSPLSLPLPPSLPPSLSPSLPLSLSPSLPLSLSPSLSPSLPFSLSPFLLQQFQHYADVLTDGLKYKHSWFGGWDIARRLPFVLIGFFVVLGRPSIILVREQNIFTVYKQS